MRNVFKKSVVLLAQKRYIGSHLCFCLITHTEFFKQVSRNDNVVKRVILIVYYRIVYCDLFGRMSAGFSCAVFVDRRLKLRNDRVEWDESEIQFGPCGFLCFLDAVGCACGVLHTKVLG